MAARIFEVAFRINGALNSQFSSSMRAAQASLRGMGVSASQANAAFGRGGQALREYSSNLNRISEHASSFEHLQERISATTAGMMQFGSRAAQLGNAFRQQQAASEQLRSRLARLNQTYEQQRSSLPRADLRELRTQIRETEREIRRQEQATRAAERAYEHANRRLSDMRTTLQSQQSQLRQTHSELQRAGFSTDDFARSQARLQDEINRTNQALQTQTRYQQARANVGQTQANLFNAYGNFQNALNTAGTILSPIVDATRAAMTFESAMADVKKVVDFETPQQFKAMQQDVLALSGTLPMAAEEIAKIVAAGGQSGIAQNDLMPFAESAVKMGIAFDVTADQAGGMMAKWRTAFSMNQAEVVGLADKINYLGNTTAAAAPLISDVITRVGPLGKVGGVASGEIAALGASMIGVGIPSDVAATGIKNLILGMVAGEGATKSQSAAFQSLGMDAGQMVRRMQTDAKGAILDVMTAIQSLDADKQASTLQALFGKESLSAISPLLSNLDNLRDNFGKVADSARYAGSMEAEYAARSQTVENQLQLAENAFKATAIAIGGQFLPTVGKLAGAFADNAKAFAEWIGQHQSLVQWAGILAGGLSAVIVGAAGVQLAFAGWAFISSAATMAGMAVSGLAARVMMLSGVQRIAAIASTAWTGAQWLLNAALTANPIGVTVMAIAALIGLIGVIVWKSDTLREALTNLWENPKQAVDDFVSYVMQRWETLKSALAHPLDAAVNLITTGSVVGGEVTAGAQETPAAAAQVDALGSASEATAGAISENANAVSKYTESMTAGGEGLAQVAEGMNLAVPSIQQMGEAVTASNPAFMEQGERLAAGNPLQVQSNELMSAGNPLRAQSNELMAATGATLSAFREALNATSSSLSGLGDSSSRASSAISHLGQAALSAWNSFQSASASLSAAAANASGGTVAANAEGGIYRKGPFLTTFAEEGPEAAIPLDGSSRAVSLWQRAGQMLGLLPESSASNRPQPIMGPMQPVFGDGGIPELSAPSIGNNSSFSMPSINVSVTINGNADAGEVERGVRDGVASAWDSFRDQYEEFLHEGRRTSFA